jgi:hypothetical protein
MRNQTVGLHTLCLQRLIQVQATILPQVVRTVVLLSSSGHFQYSGRAKRIYSLKMTLL